MRRPRLARSVPVALILLLVVAGCGNDKKGDSAQSSSPASSGASAGPVAASGQPTTTTTTIPCQSLSPLKGRTDPVPVVEQPLDKAAVTTHTDIPGTGRAAVKGDTVSVKYTGWIADGTTATAFDSSSLHGGAAIQVTLGTGQAGTYPASPDGGFTQGLIGVQPGERRTIVMGGDKGYGAQPPSGANIPANASLAFTVDVDAVFPAAIDGREAPSPAVTPDPGNKDALQTNTDTPGDGAAVVHGDTVVLQFVVWLANGKSTDIIESSWAEGGAVNINVDDPGTTPGLGKGLIGAKPGERRKIVFGSNLGYGDAGHDPTVPGGAALAYEVDVIGILPGC
jgi:FKBP-type peptidyl-prolyl cis-trans isomerase